MTTFPDRTEAAEYYFTYIDQVSEGDIAELLDAQRADVLDLLGGISEPRSLQAYAPGKWSIRDVVGHIIDTERLFVYRAFWFARNFESPLPSFDQNTAITAARADDRAWTSLVEEFRLIRAATTAFFGSLPEDAWARRGIASDSPFTVRALAYLTVGHVAHHVTIIRERYLV